MGSYGQYSTACWAIGKQRYYRPTGSTPPNSNRMLVVDLTNLNVVVNEVYTGNDQVPVSVHPYVVNPRYLPIVSTPTLLTGHVPQGTSITC